MTKLRGKECTGVEDMYQIFINFCQNLLLIDTFVPCVPVQFIYNHFEYYKAVKFKFLN